MGIEKKSVYVRLEPEETLHSKREFLEITESIIKLMIISRKFKSLLNKESSSIGKWTKEAEKVSGEIGEIKTLLPKQDDGREEIERP